jgi:assimilatory nitrate reductase catalytic subunit
MSRTGLVGQRFGHAAEPSVDLHPSDIARLKLGEADIVRLRSSRGEVLLPVQSSDSAAPDQAFVAMHWGEEFVSGRGALAGVNALTSSALCPRSKQPELQHSAVRNERVDLAWRLLAVIWVSADTLEATRTTLRARMATFDFATMVPFGQHREALLLRAASARPVDPALLTQLEDALGMPQGDGSPLRLADPARGQRRTIRLVAMPLGHARIESFVITGDASSQAWVLPMLQQELPAPTSTRQLLASGHRPLNAPRRRQVCNCLDIDESAITRSLSRDTGSAEERLARLHAQLRCGTQCGSCLPELRRLARVTELAA